MENNSKTGLTQFIANNLSAKTLFIIAALALTGQNIFHLTQNILKTEKKLKFASYTFLGNKFHGLDQFLPNVERIGYFTDKNLDDNTSAAQYAQAQYVMAPIILDLNYKEYEYVIFDCTNEIIAYKKMKDLGLSPYKRNQYGIILAKRK